MDEVELAARKTVKAPVRAVLRLFSEEMADFAEHNEVGVIHYRILDVYKALCGLTSCLDSDDPKLTSGELLRQAMDLRETWRKHTKGKDT